MPRPIFHPVDIGEVGTIAIGGWVLGSLVFGVVFIVMTLVAAPFGGELLMFIPMLLFMVLFGVGLLSVVWVMPTALLLIMMLRLFGATWRFGALVCVVVGFAYAIGLSRMPEDWRWWSDFWYAAPIYGAALGWVYARTCDV